jgi:hypothetical protein
MSGLHNFLSSVFANARPRRDHAVRVAEPDESSPGEPDHVSEPSFTILERATDTAIAPLAPIFVAMAAEWAVDIPPSTALRSVLLMAVLGESAQDLAGRVTTEAPLRKFLRMKPRQRLDATSVSRGQERLIANSNARQVVRAVMAKTRADGLFDRSGFVEDHGLVAAWTRDVESNSGDRTATLRP